MLTTKVLPILCCCFVCAMAQTSPTLTPATLTATLSPGQSITEDKSLFLPADVTPPTADIIFAIDLTGSMGGILSNVQAYSIAIMNQIRGVIPNTRFGVVSFRDYYGSFSGCGYTSSYGSSGDLPYVLDQPLTDDATLVSNAINSMSVSGGSDGPESYTRVLYESYADPAAGWRTGSKKILILWGDNIPHDCNYGLDTLPGLSTGPDPGRDATVETEDDLDLATVLNEMAQNKVTLIALNNGYTALWNYYARKTGGNGFPISSSTGDDIPTYLTKLISEEVKQIDTLRLAICTPGFETWLTSLTPAHYLDVNLDSDKTFPFDIGFTVPVATPPATYNFTVCAMGDGVNYAEQQVTITVPNMHLPVIADAGPDQRVYVSPSCSASVTLDGTGSYDPDGGSIVSYSWQLPTGGTLTGATPSVTLPIGSHNIVLTVVDEDRDSAKDSVVITVVNRKPRITLPADMTINEGTELRIRVTASDSDGTIPSITATGLPEGAVFTDSGNGAGLLFWSTGCNDHGVYTIMFIAEDCADTSMKPFNLTVTDVNFPPEFIKHDDTTSSENTELRMKIVAVDCDGDNPSVKAVSIPGGATFVDNGDGTGTLRWIPECSDNGYYVMVFEASDGYISVRDTVVVRIIDVNCYPPEITLSDRDITSGTHIPITVAIHTIDRDETIARLEIGDLPAGATITSDGSGNAVFSWTPGALGTYTIKVTAIDEVDPSVRVDTTILITIAYGNFTGPQFLPCSDTIIDENTPLSFVVSAQDPDGSIPEIRKVTLPADASLTDNCDGTARIDWLPDCASNGNHLFTICATDGAFTDTLTVMVTVRDQNCPPVINPITDRNVPYGSTVRFTVSATDPDGEVVPEISVSCDLDGYSFTVPTPGSAVFEWNAMASSGSFTVTFYATDGFLSDTETVVISVNTSGSLYIAAKPSGALIRRSPSGGFAGSHIGTDSAVVTDVPGVYWFSAGAPGYSTKHFAGKIISDTTCSLSVELKPSIQKMIVVADTARFGSTTTPGIDGSIGFVDFDGDGLQDLSVATGKTFSIFPGNDSLKGLKYRTPAINLSVPATLDSIVSHLYTDWDNDGDYECLLSLAGGTVMIAELDNEEIAPGAVVVIRSGETLFPVVVDLDKDNRKDLVLISSGKGVYFYKNNATDSAPAFDTPVKVTDNSGRGITTLKGAALIVDMDGDDSTDLIATGTDFVQLFKNGMGSLSGELPAGEDLNAGGERIKGNSGSIALLPLANSHPGFALLKKGRLLVYRLRLLGDISGDGKVNINDISKIAKAWETTPDHSSWNPACNLRLSPADGEEIINIGDITRASKAWESEE